MNIYNINQRFEKLQTLESYLFYKIYAKYYNSKPTKRKIHKEINSNKSKQKKTTVDESFIKTLILNEKMIDNQSKKLLKAKSMNQNGYYHIRRIINYSLEDTPPIKELYQSPNYWYKKNRNKSFIFNKEVEMSHCKSKKMQLWQSLITSRQIKKTFFEKESKEKGKLNANIVMSHRLKDFYAKKYKFSAETMPKINLGDFENQTKAINQNYNDLYHKLIKVKTKFDNNIPICPLEKIIKENIKFKDKITQITQQEELYHEINRSNIDFSRSIRIKIPNATKNFSFRNKNRRNKSAKDEIKKYITKATVSKCSSYSHFNNKKRLLKIDNRNKFNIC